MLGIQAQFDETLGVGGGFTVGAHVNDGIGVVDPRQTDRALHALQQGQVDAVGLADLPGGHVGSVVTDEVAGGQQQWRIGRPDLFGGDALLEQPLQQFRPLGACAALESFEQVVLHFVNVQREPIASAAKPGEAGRHQQTRRAMM